MRRSVARKIAVLFHRLPLKPIVLRARPKLCLSLGIRLAFFSMPKAVELNDILDGGVVKFVDTLAKLVGLTYDGGEEEEGVGDRVETFPQMVLRTENGRAVC